MFDTFEKLPDDRKKRILDACTAEFAKNGYERASTNEIVKAAGISKGTLFLYFGNKKNLYLYMLDRILDHVISEYYTNVDEMPSDLFERLMHSALIKMKIAFEEPLVYEIVFKTFVNTPEELKAEVDERYQRLYGTTVSNYFNKIDTGKFRKGVDLQKAISIIMFFLDGYYNSYLAAHKNISAEKALSQLDVLMKESIEYLDIIKKGIYN